MTDTGANWNANKAVAMAASRHTTTAAVIPTPSLRHAVGPASAVNNRTPPHPQRTSSTHQRQLPTPKTPPHPHPPSGSTPPQLPSNTSGTNRLTYVTARRINAARIHGHPHTQTRKGARA